MRDLTNALCAEERQFQFALGGKFQREEHLARVCAVLCDAARRAAQEVARDDEVGIRAADAARALRRDLAGAHVAVFAADPRHAECALRLLIIEAVERRIAADLLHVEQHLAHRRVGRLLEHLLARRERLAVCRDRLHVVVHTAVRVRMRRVMRVRVPLVLRVLMIMRMHMIMIVRVVMSMIVRMGVVMPMRVDVLMSCFSCRSHRHLS